MKQMKNTMNQRMNTAKPAQQNAKESDPEFEALVDEIAMLISEYMTETEIDSIASETGKALAKEPKVTITIQPEGGEAYWEGGVNGHFFRIRTGEPVAVP